jgi:hypothetical protein
LNQLQAELKSEHPNWDFQLLGVNQFKFESGNPDITRGRNLPWLQDVDLDGDQQSDNFMNAWDYEYRDLVIVGPDNRPVDVYNLTINSLATPANYATLKQKLIAAIEATEPTSPWTNPVDPLDVDNDTFVSPLDALLILNELNSVGARQIEPPSGSNGPPPYIDTTGDGFVSPLDSLLVINRLNEINVVQGPVDAVPASSNWTIEGEPTEPTGRPGGGTSALMAGAVDEIFFNGDTGGSQKRRGITDMGGDLPG